MPDKSKNESDTGMDAGVRGSVVGNRTDGTFFCVVEEKVGGTRFPSQKVAVSDGIM